MIPQEASVEEPAKCELQRLYDLRFRESQEYPRRVWQIVTVLIIAADNVFRQRRFPWIALAFAGGIFFFWVLAGQQLTWGTIDKVTLN